MTAPTLTINIHYTSLTRNNKLQSLNLMGRLHRSMHNKQCKSQCQTRQTTRLKFWIYAHFLTNNQCQSTKYLGDALACLW